MTMKLSVRRAFTQGYYIREDTFIFENVAWSCLWSKFTLNIQLFASAYKLEHRLLGHLAPMADQYRDTLLLSESSLQLLLERKCQGILKVTSTAKRGATRQQI